MNKVWGFLQETTELAQKAGIDKDTGLIRTGLNEYFDVIQGDKDIVSSIFQIMYINTTR